MANRPRPQYPPTHSNMWQQMDGQQHQGGQLTSNMQDGLRNLHLHSAPGTTQQVQNPNGNATNELGHPPQVNSYTQQPPPVAPNYGGGSVHPGNFPSATRARSSYLPSPPVAGESYLSFKSTPLAPPPTSTPQMGTVGNVSVGGASQMGTSSGGVSLGSHSSSNLSGHTSDAITSGPSSNMMLRSFSVPGGSTSLPGSGPTMPVVPNLQQPSRYHSGPPNGPPTGNMAGIPTGPSTGPSTVSVQGPPTNTSSGPPGTLRGSVGPSPGTVRMGPPTGTMGPPTRIMGPPTGIMGPPTGTTGPPTGTMGPPTRITGPPTDTTIGPPSGTMGPTTGTMGPPTDTTIGPPSGTMGPPTGTTGPPTDTTGPPTGTMGPPTGAMGPPTGAMGPLTGAMGPPTGTMGPPTGTMGPPTGTMGPPTRITGPPTGTMGPPTGTMGLPTGTVGPPTGTTGPPTGTTGPPTGTIAPPTGTTGLLTGTTGPPSGVFGVPPSTNTYGSSAGPPPGPPGNLSLATRSRYPVAPPTQVSTSGLGGASQPTLPGGGKVTLSQPGPPGRSGPTTPSLPGQPHQSPADPFLRPVNILENRTILPELPPAPPPIVLPNGQGRFAPSHRVFCSTLNVVPATSSLLNKLKLPLAIHIHPFKDMNQKECPVIHPSVIVRCRSCRAYISPYVTFLDSRHWRCNMCFRSNSLPEDFDYNPATGRHGDRSHRIELKKSSVEYLAPSEYMVRPPQPSVYYFVVDVSFGSVDSGVLSVFCRTLLEHLDRLPGDARTLVGLLTFDSSLHFYTFTGSLSQPQMLVVSDVDDVFLPCPESLLVNLREFKEMFRSLLEDLPRMFSHNHTDRNALGPALQAASKLLHPIGGRITVLQCALPSVGPGALKYRDVAPASTKMPSLNMAPASDFYKSLALDCNAQQISIDIFAFSGKFMDLSTLSCAAKFSSGEVFHYHNFHHSRKPARQKFQKDFERYLTRRIGFEAVMRIRCTEGLSLHTFHGNFFVRSTDLLSLPNVNPDLSYTMNISIDDSLKDLGSVCFQTALLYTSSRGERRIRVHTLSLPVSEQLSHIYARANILAITGTLANMAVDRSVSSSLGDAREALMNTAVDCGKMYRTNMGSSRQGSQYILPHSLSLLPLFIIALLKSPAFTLSTKVNFDSRVQMLNLIKCTPFDYLQCLMYPRLYAVHMLTERDVMEKDDGSQELAPPLIHLSAEKLNRYGVFLMDYGLGLYLWVCKDASPGYLSNTLDVKHFGAIPEIMMDVPVLETEANVLLRRFVKQIRSTRQHYLPLQVIREDGPHRLLFIERLVDDRTELGTSYYELLSHIARQLNK